MHDLLIGLVYIAMLLTPCVVATWGDSPIFLWDWQVDGRRMGWWRLSEAHASVPAPFEAEAGFAFHIRVAEPFVARTGARPATIAFAEAQQRVANRLAQLVAEHAANIAAERAEVAEIAALAADVARVVEHANPQYAEPEYTPSARELDELYAETSFALRSEPGTLESIEPVGRNLHEVNSVLGEGQRDRPGLAALHDSGIPLAA